ncbi:MAG: ABC transporter permease [Bacteroidetes bacterium]|nr:ABC transporter permease [Bacteroidota bacterium]MBS1686293.1 ABC transporter permease [Bacteroidota bacterium]
MKQLLAFVRKEFYHVFRDKKTLLMLFGVPIAQIVLFGFTLTNEIKNSRIVVADYAHDYASQEIIRKIEASRYFEVVKSNMSHDEIEAAFKTGTIKMAVIFPANFYNDLSHLNKAQIQVIADASDPNTATTLTSYLNNIITDYQTQKAQQTKVPYLITPEVKMLYNPELLGAPNFVPGVMALVLMLICAMMTSISIVKEKELGTMEILLVSPIRPFLLIISKVIPYLLVSIINLITILVLSVVLLHLEIKGSLLLLFLESTLFIISSLALGLLISVRAESQMAAMMTSQMSLMLPTMLLTGFMFPIENMPLPMRALSYAFPSHYYYIIVKAVMLEGLGFMAIWKETLILAFITTVLVIINLRSFKIRLA